MLCFDLYKDSRYYRSFVLKDEETNEIYRQTFKISFFELRKAVSELSQTKEVETFELSGLTAEINGHYLLTLVNRRCMKNWLKKTKHLRKHMSV